MTKDKTITKKLLVGYEPTRRNTASSDFLIPMQDSTGLFLFGLKSKKPYEQGQMVYIGKEITADDVFAKLVDSGCRNDDVQGTLQTLDAYLRMLQDYRIGNILRIEPNVENACGFCLIKIAEHEPFEKKKLP